MLRNILRYRLAVAIAALCATTMSAQTSPSITPLRTSPKETFTVNPGHRDWTEAVISGTTILSGNSSNRGGLFAVDITSGKLKWTARPAGLPGGNPYVATMPAISGNLAIVPMADSLVAITLAGGKEAWRGPRTAINASVAADASTAFVLGQDRVFYAVDAATGKTKWTLPFANRGSCTAAPVLRDGTVYVSGAMITAAGDASRPASSYEFLMAIDATTGKERWRYPSAPIPGNNQGVCLEQPLLAGNTLFGTVSQTLHAVDLATGKQRWAPVEIRRPVDGRERSVALGGLVDAGPVLVGMTSGFLIGFDKATGKTAWEVKGQYRANRPATAVAGNVLYFQGHPGAEPASENQDRIVYQGGKPVPTVPALPGGRLNAMDLETREILWSFSRPTAEPNWAFGFVTPVDGGLWVDSYQALVKLQ
jgi:outer membrane protein assembly factor BamB